MEEVPQDSSSRLAAQVSSLSTLAKYRHLFRLLGFTEAADALDEVPAMAEQARELLEMPGRFNSIFLPLGWIAYERLDTPTSRKAVELAEAGDPEAAESVLIDYYSPETVRQHLQSLTAVRAYQPRLDLLQLALIDYGLGRYHACVPVVLAQIDGVMFDVTGRESFFLATEKRKTPLVAWDSISARPDASSTSASRCLDAAREKRGGEGCYRRLAASLQLPVPTFE